MNNKLIIIIFIAHVIGDFYLQTDKLAEKKENKFSGILQHGLYYCIPYIFYFIFCKFSFRLSLAIIVTCFLHIFIDCLKFIYQKLILKLRTEDSILCKESYIYLVDQLLHIITIIFVAFLFNKTSIDIYNWVIPFLEFIQIDVMVISRWVLLILLIYKPINITYGKIFSAYKPLCKEEEREIDASKDKTNNLHIAEIQSNNKSSMKMNISSHNKLKNDKRNEKDKRAGAVIGFMERLIIVIFLSLQEYAAIGLVITAKSIVRYDRISSEQEFSEYYLIGTLFSFISALGAYYFIIA